MTKVEALSEMKRLHEEINSLKIEDTEKRDTLQKEFDALDKEFHGGEGMATRALLRERSVIAASDAQRATGTESQQYWTEYNNNIRQYHEADPSQLWPMYNGKNESEIRSFIEKEMTPSFSAADLPIGNDRTEPKISKQYRSIFHPSNPQRSFDSGKFTSGGEFFETVLSDRYDPRLRELRTQVVGSGGGGGYLVPDVVVAELFSVAIESQIVLPRASVYPTNTDNIIRVPKWADDSHANNMTHGGFIPRWLGENTTDTAQTAVMGFTELTPRYLQLFNNASIQMESSVSNFQSIMQKSMSDSINFTMDDAFINGDGVGKPTGILKSDSLLTATKTILQTADSISYSNCAQMFSMLAPSCINGAVWIASPSTIPQLLQLYTSAGDGGQSYGVLHETNGQFTLFGKPMLFTEKAGNLGDFGDLILADLSQYLVCIKNMILFDRSTAVEWYNNLASYRITIGVDGASAWTSALTTKGGGKLSWAVALQERA